MKRSVEPAAEPGDTGFALFFLPTFSFLLLGQLHQKGVAFGFVAGLVLFPAATGAGIIPAHSKDFARLDLDRPSYGELFRDYGPRSWPTKQHVENSPFESLY